MKSCVPLEDFEYSIVSGRLYKCGKLYPGFDFGKYKGMHFNATHILMHRFIWFLVTGEWPEFEIDHVDQNKHNNCWFNLREATHSQNGQNRQVYSSNHHGTKGVGWHKKSNRWRARIAFDHKTIELGYFDTIEEAQIARENAEKEYFTHAV